MVYDRWMHTMKKEKPTQLGCRVFKRQRYLIKRKAAQLTKVEGSVVSEAEVVRRAIDAFV